MKYYFDWANTSPGVRQQSWLGLLYSNFKLMNGIIRSIWKRGVGGKKLITYHAYGKLKTEYYYDDHYVVRIKYVKECSAIGR